MGSKKFTGVSFVIVRPKGEVLLELRDGKSKFYPNTRCFPGEGSEGNEEPFETVIRGIQEEFGIRVEKDFCEFLTMNHLSHISQEVAVFICKIDDTQIPELREAADMRWMKIDEIEKIKLGFEQNKFVPLVKKKLEDFWVDARKIKRYTRA